MPVAVKQSRAARALVAAFSARVGPWQSQCAKLSAIAGRRTPGDRAELLAALEALTADIAAARQELAADIAAAPEEIRTHSRVADALRAADIVSARVEALRSRLDPA